MPSSQILLTEEFVEKMLEDLEDLTSPEEVSLFDFSLMVGLFSRCVCVYMSASAGCSLRCWDRLKNAPRNVKWLHFSSVSVNHHHPLLHPRPCEDTQQIV